MDFFYFIQELILLRISGRFAYSDYYVYCFLGKSLTAALVYQIIVLQNLLFFEKICPLYVLLIFTKLPACTLCNPAHIEIIFLLTIVKIMFVQSFVSKNWFRLPLLLLVEKSEGCICNFPSCMLYSILHTLLTFEKFPSCTLYFVCTIIW